MKLGLAARTFAVLAHEDQTQFDDYTRDLVKHHQPANTVEWTLVCKMAQHHWCSQRAFIAQDTCFTVYGNAPDPEKQRQLTVYLRYQATHDRQFHKCLQQLEHLQAERRQSAADDAKKQATTAAETRRSELHALRLEIATLKRNREASRPPATAPSTAQPSTTKVPIAA